MNATDKRYDLEERLLEYSACLVRLVERMKPTRAGYHVGGHVLRASTSAFFNHGEAESAESPGDFVHKMGVCLKELRETKRALRLVHRVPLIQEPTEVTPVLAETEELIRIFFASIRTARKNARNEGGEFA